MTLTKPSPSAKPLTSGKMSMNLNKVAARDNLERAACNLNKQGAPGIDGVPAKDAIHYLRTHQARIQQAIKTGTYKPSPVKRVEIPKAGGKVRVIGIPTVKDRLVQEALRIQLEPLYEPSFMDTSYGFRPNRSPAHMIQKTSELLNQGYTWVTKLDIQQYFDSIPHGKLIEVLRQRIGSEAVIKLTQAIMQARMDHGDERRTGYGLIQGGNLSPLLANIYLDQLDRELEARGIKSLRYADDVILLSKSHKAAERSRESTIRFIEGRLKLKVNRDKTWTGPATEPDLSILGFSFMRGSDGRYQSQVSIKAVGRLIKDLNLMEPESTALQRERKLNGWTAYYATADADLTADQMKDIDEAIRRMLPISKGGVQSPDTKSMEERWNAARSRRPKRGVVVEDESWMDLAMKASLEGISPEEEEWVRGLFAQEDAWMAGA